MVDGLRSDLVSGLLLSLKLGFQLDTSFLHVHLGLGKPLVGELGKVRSLLDLLGTELSGLVELLLDSLKGRW